MDFFLSVTLADSALKISDVVWLDGVPNLSLSTDWARDFPSAGMLRSMDSLGDLVGGVDAEDVRSLDEPFCVWLS